MTWLVVVAVVAAGVVVVGLQVARRPQSLTDLADPLTSTPGPLPLPESPSVVSRADLEALRFDRALRGYDSAEVDDRLEAIADQLDGPVDAESMASGHAQGSLRALADAPLSRRMFGYRMDQVDRVLDRWSHPDGGPGAADPPRPGDGEGGEGGHDGLGSDDTAEVHAPDVVHAVPVPPDLQPPSLHSRQEGPWARAEPGHLAEFPSPDTSPSSRARRLPSARTTSHPHRTPRPPWTW